MYIFISSIFNRYLMFLVFLLFIFVLIVATLLSFVFTSLRSQTCPSVLSHTPNEPIWRPVPKLIPVWMFWDSTPLPQTVQLCWNNWSHWCAKSIHNFVPILVTDENIDKLIDTSIHPCFNSATTYGPALRSDFIRLALLRRYGGVYMDATVILTEPLDWIMDKKLRGHNFFQAMYNPSNMTMSCSVPVIESSFLFAPPEHPLVSKWLERMMELKQCTSEEIERLTSNVPKQANLEDTYHFAYHIMTHILMETSLSEFGMYHLYNSKELKYLNFNFNNVNDLTSVSVIPKFGPILKLISEERKILENKIDLGQVAPGSFIDSQLIQLPHVDTASPTHFFTT